MSDIDINITEEALEFDVMATGPQGEAGNDGDSSYTYVAYASDDQGTGFSLTPASNLTFIAVLTTDTEIASPEASDFASLWTEYKSDIQNFDDLTDVTITDGAENDLLTLESGVWVNKTREEVGNDTNLYKKAPIDYDIDNLYAWDNFIRDNGSIGDTDSGQSWQSFDGQDLIIENNRVRTTGDNMSSMVIPFGQGSVLMEGHVRVTNYTSISNLGGGFIVGKDSDNYFYGSFYNDAKMELRKVIGGVESVVETTSRVDGLHERALNVIGVSFQVIFIRPNELESNTVNRSGVYINPISYPDGKIFYEMSSSEIDLFTSNSDVAFIGVRMERDVARMSRFRAIKII